MTNLYTVGGNSAGETYTALFAGSGFRYAQISGLPAGFTPAAGLMTAKMVHSDVKYSGRFRKKFVLEDAIRFEFCFVLSA
jgi:alpha-L-rhamnosidase